MKAYLVDAGLISYAEGLYLQDIAMRARAEGRLGMDVLFLLEHTPVITLGKQAQEHMLRLPRETITKEYGIQVYSASRGGKATYHGPGQVVGYPILDFTARKETMSSLFKHEYSEKLERVMLSLGQKYVQDLFCRKDINPETGKRYVGVWHNSAPIKKVGAVGVDIITQNHHFISTHGFALNVQLAHPEHFDLIDPCGLKDVKSASLAELCKKELSIPDIKTQLAQAFAHVFGYEFETISCAGLKEIIK